MEIADVDDDDANEELQRNASDQHGQHEVVEPVSFSANVEQEFQFSYLGER